MEVVLDEMGITEKIDTTSTGTVSRDIMCNGCGKENLKIITEMNIELHTYGSSNSALKCYGEYIMPEEVCFFYNACSGSTTNVALYICPKCGRPIQ